MVANINSRNMALNRCILPVMSAFQQPATPLRPLALPDAFNLKELSRPETGSEHSVECARQSSSPAFRALRLFHSRTLITLQWVCAKLNPLPCDYSFALRFFMCDTTGSTIHLYVTALKGKYSLQASSNSRGLMSLFQSSAVRWRWKSQRL